MPVPPQIVRACCVHCIVSEIQLVIKSSRNFFLQTMDTHFGAFSKTFSISTWPFMTFMLCGNHNNWSYFQCTFPGKQIFRGIHVSLFGAAAAFVEVDVSLFVTRWGFGEVHTSVFVAATAFGDTFRSRNSSGQKSWIILYNRHKIWEILLIFNRICCGWTEKNR